MKYRPSLSVIIPAYNEEKLLPKLIECLENQTIDSFEIIIADANSTDNTKNIILESNATYVQGGIPSIGRNRGASKARGDILVFFDADVVFNNSFLEIAAREFVTQKLDFANTKYYHEGKIKHLSIFLNFFRKHLKYPPLGAQCLLIKRKVFKSLGGFNETRSVGEDVEFGNRAYQAGFKYGFIENTNIVVSNRRVEKVGLLKLVFIGFIEYIYGFLFKEDFVRRQKFFEVLYGDWGYK